MIAPAVAAGTLAASVMARIQLPWQPRDLGGSEPIAVLMKNQELGNGCGLERGERGWALCGRPLSICPCRLQAALLPPQATRPRWRPHGGARGPPKRQRSPPPGTLGPTCGEELRALSGGQGGEEGRERLSWGWGGARRGLSSPPGQRDAPSSLGQGAHADTHAPAPVAPSRIAWPPLAPPVRTDGFTEAPTVCPQCPQSTP